MREDAGHSSEHRSWAQWGPWFRRFRPPAQAQARVVCLPHAGGSASSFWDLARHLPSRVDVVGVQYPGRGDRIGERCVDDLQVLSDEIAAAAAELTDLPVLLFGHSLGAAVAFEVAVRLTERGREPQALLVSGRAAPRHDCAGTVHCRDEEGIWAEITRLGGTAAEIAESPEWRALITPAIRADFRASETYQPTTGVVLPCPVAALVGADDPDVSEQHAGDWRAFCAGEFRLRSFAGGHFYLIEQVRAVAAEILRLVGEDTAARSPSTP